MARSLVLVFLLALALAWAATTIRLPDLRETERTLEEARSLRFSRAVEVRTTTADEVRDYVKKQFARQVDARAWKAVLHDFGLVPRNLDPYLFYLKLVSQQVAAYYDPETRYFYYKPDLDLFKEPQEPVLPGVDLLQLTWLHEMEHALQDQNFDLTRLIRLVASRKQGDLDLATSALVEGDAMLVMLYPISRQTHLSVEALARFGSLMKALSATDPELAKAPLIFREGLLFPYTAGLQFVADLKRWGGWPLVNEAFYDLPQTTHQILHPEHYAIYRRWPEEISIPRPPEQKPLAEDSLGEMVLSILLKTFSVKRVDVSRCRADHFLIVPDGREVIVWVVDWEDAKEAGTFFHAVAQILKKKHPGFPLRSLSPTEKIQGGVETSWIRREGKRVLVVEGARPERIGTWKKLALQARAHREPQTPKAVAWPFQKFPGAFFPLHGSAPSMPAGWKAFATRQERFPFGFRNQAGDRAFWGEARLPYGGGPDLLEAGLRHAPERLMRVLKTGEVQEAGRFKFLWASGTDEHGNPVRLGIWGKLDQDTARLLVSLVHPRRWEGEKPGLQFLLEQLSPP